MATITVFKFNTPDGAEKMLNLVKELTKSQLITLEDAATVSWPQGKKKPKTRQLADLTGFYFLAPPSQVDHYRLRGWQRDTNTADLPFSVQRIGMCDR